VGAVVLATAKTGHASSSYRIFIPHFIEHVQKIWENIPCTDCTGQGNDFELIPMAIN